MYKTISLLALTALLFTCTTDEEDPIVPQEPERVEVETDQPTEPALGQLMITDKDGNKNFVDGASIIVPNNGREMIFLTDGEVRCDGEGSPSLGAADHFVVGFYLEDEPTGKYGFDVSLIILPQPDGSQMHLMNGFCHLDRLDPNLIDQETGLNTAAGDAACRKEREVTYPANLEITRIDDEVIEGTLSGRYYFRPEAESGVNRLNTDDLIPYGEIVTHFKVAAPVRCN